MPKSITFFSRGKTPIYVNYVIAHNTRGAPAHTNPVRKYYHFKFKATSPAFQATSPIKGGKS